jgi:hypothetical protein
LFLACASADYVRKEIPPHIAKIMVDPKAKIHREIPITVDDIKPPVKDPFRKKHPHEIGYLDDNEYTVEEIGYDDHDLHET